MNGSKGSQDLIHHRKFLNTIEGVILLRHYKNIDYHYRYYYKEIFQILTWIT